MPVVIADQLEKPDAGEPYERAALSPSAALAAPASGLGNVFVRGMIWGTIGLFVGKLTSFVATLFLGWIFTSKEYGDFGAVLSAAMIGDVLTDGGLRRVLVTRGSEYDRIGRTGFFVALAFNLLGCFLMFRAAPWYRDDHPDAVLPLVVTGIALVLSSFGTIQKCKQSIEMQFGQIAFMSTLSALLRNVLTVLFAWLFMRVWHRPDLGPLAFALPLIAFNLWEAAYVYRTIGRVPHAPFDAGIARELVRQGKWVMLAMAGGALIYRGDYLVATWVLKPVFDVANNTTVNVVGQYVFGFQLTVALFSPFSIGMAAVIQPVMARLRNEPARQANAFLRMVRTSLFLAAPASLGAVFVTPLMIHTLWPHRTEWHACIPVIQIIAATECVRQMHHMCLATIDGRGQWKHSALLIVIDGLLTVTAAFIGCMVGVGTGTLMTLTIAVAIERTVVAVAQAVYTYWLIGGKARAILIQILPPVAIGLTVGGVVAVLTIWIPTSPVAHRWLLALASVPAVAGYVGLAKLLTPARFDEAAELVLSRLRRQKGVAVAEPAGV